MIGKTVSHYQIIEEIGRGGMGVVYKARDLSLDRLVALKFLPAQFSADEEEKKRFVHEAKAASALDHANICSVYEIGETPEGQLFIAMGYYEGKTLKELITVGARRAVPLPFNDVINIAMQVAEGLQEAHRKGIVHRDLKPANIMVTEQGVVKIVDFGLAKLKGLSRLTKTGTTLGTVAYMSPEQALGKEVDQRSDIWSLGVILYEMLSGKLPFPGEYDQAVLYAVINKEPEPVAKARPDASSGLEQIVGQALAKDPAKRYQHIDDLLVDLRRVREETRFAASTQAGSGLSGPAHTKPAKSMWFTGRRRVAGVALAGAAALIAAGLFFLRQKPNVPAAQVTRPPKIIVLPFENLGAPEDAYFASGMAEEITSRLANVRGLAVISRTTAMEYDRKGKTIKQIGSDLGVDYVLEGSVRWEHRAGGENRVRITPQLIRVTDDTHVWAERYERMLEEVFAIQSEVAENVVKAMGVTLLPHEQTALKEISTSDLEAYDLYLRGQEFYASGSERRYYESALQMYQAAVDKDPNFALALAGLARSHLAMYWYYYDRSPERVERAREAAEQAVKIRPDLAEVHVALGFYYYHGKLDYQRASDSFAAAQRIEPNNSQALYGGGLVLRRQGYWQDSVNAIGKALELDSKNAVMHYNFAESCILARRYAEADSAYGLAIALSPQWYSAYLEKAWLQIQWHGDVSKAQAILEEAQRVAVIENDSETGVVYSFLNCRDFQKLSQLFQIEKHTVIDNQFRYLPMSLLQGQLQLLTDQSIFIQRYIEDARIELEQKIRECPDDARFHSSLGITYAILGRRQDAVREAKRGCDLMPPAKDAWRALYRLEDLAFVYTTVGQQNEAIALLEELLARSGDITPHVLRLDLRWGRLQANPRFKDLLRKYEVKL
jgi:TolB-like protein/Flp pilus assembly protein TadD/predicted Ser/Thr protein kinase